MSTSLEATVAMLARQVVMLERQVSALMLRRGAPFALARTTLAVNDTGPVQTVQAQLDALSTRDYIPLLYGFGVTGSPPIGTDLHLAFLDGDRAKSLAIAGDLHVTGAVIAGYGGADQVGLQTHKHGEGTAAAGTTAPTANT